MRSPTPCEPERCSKCLQVSMSVATTKCPMCGYLPKGAIRTSADPKRKTPFVSVDKPGRQKERAVFPGKWGEVRLRNPGV